MNPIQHLREELDQLEDALQRAGSALIEAEACDANPKELKALLISFGICGHQRHRRQWLIEMGQLQRWHEGRCASSIPTDETHDSGQCPEPLLRIRNRDEVTPLGVEAPENPVERAL